MSVSIEHMGGKKPAADVVVVGGGVIGLTIALEMQERGAEVIVVERGEVMRQASWAAAGMLAVDDPGNPPELWSLAKMSVELYPAFLRKMERRSGLAVPFQTESALQYAGDGSVTRLAEWSIDPRQLAAAVVGTVRSSRILLMERFEVEAVEDLQGGLKIVGRDGTQLTARHVVYAAGAWAPPGSGLRKLLVPRKGQMLRVGIPSGLTLHDVHRSEEVYVVPRRFGAQAGTALIGATVEDVGFDVTVHEADLSRMRALAAELVPELGSEDGAPRLEAWAGLRPATPDGLPLLGALAANRFIAGGHYRNGVLLAPATAAVMSDMLTGKRPGVDVSAFSPGRFGR